MGLNRVSSIRELKPRPPRRWLRPCRPLSRDRVGPHCLPLIGLELRRRLSAVAAAAVAASGHQRGPFPCSLCLRAESGVEAWSSIRGAAAPRPLPASPCMHYCGPESYAGEPLCLAFHR